MRPWPLRAPVPMSGGLGKFCKENDRNLTAFFVGRMPEMEGVEASVDEVDEKRAAGRNNPATGSTVLITGIPGAGKTPLTYELEEKWAPDSDDGPVAVRLPVEVLGDWKVLGGLLRDHLPRSPGGWLSRRLGSVDVGLLGIGFAMKTVDGEKILDLNGMECPVALLVEEIQNIPKDPDSPAAPGYARRSVGSGTCRPCRFRRRACRHRDLAAGRRVGAAAGGWTGGT